MNDITPQALAIELVDAIPRPKSSADFITKGQAYAKSKRYKLVDEKGTEYDLKEVLEAIAPTDDDIEKMQGEEVEEETEAVASGKSGVDPSDVLALAEVVSKRIERSEARQDRIVDARIKSLRITGGEARNDDDKKHGFKTMGDFAMSVQQWATTQSQDERLLKSAFGPDYDGPRIKAPTTFGSTGIGADGGFLVPPDFRTTINEYLFSDQALLPLTDVITVSGNTITVPRDETTPWGGDGVQVNWIGEKKNRDISQSKPELGEDTIKLGKLAALVPVTEELMSDSAVALDGYLSSKVGPKMDYAIADAIVNGNGDAKPLGILQSKALVTVAKESGQAADTIVTKNIVKMVEAHHAQGDNSVCWLHHRTAYSQIATVTLGDQPMFIPAGRLGDKAGAALQGYPLKKHQACQILGDKGDLGLFDFSAYQTVVKTEGVRQDVSMHLYFDTDDLAFRFVFRVSGQPKFTAPITDDNGNGKSSPFVVLAERA